MYITETGFPRNGNICSTLCPVKHHCLPLYDGWTKEKKLASINFNSTQSSKEMAVASKPQPMLILQTQIHLHMKNLMRYIQFQHLPLHCHLCRFGCKLDWPYLCLRFNNISAAASPISFYTCEKKLKEVSAISYSFWERPTKLRSESVILINFLSPNHACSSCSKVACAYFFFSIV